MEVSAYIGLGANLDDPAAQVEYAFADGCQCSAQINGRRGFSYAALLIGHGENSERRGSLGHARHGINPPV